MDITVEKPTEEMLANRRVRGWPIWEKEASRIDWHYDQTEECYLLEGRVVVETRDGGEVEFQKGDFVTFSKGLSCTRDIKGTRKETLQFQVGPQERSRRSSRRSGRSLSPAALAAPNVAFIAFSVRQAGLCKKIVFCGMLCADSEAAIPE